MTPDEIIYHRRVRLLALAVELANISEAGRHERSPSALGTHWNVGDHIGATSRWLDHAEGDSSGDQPKRRITRIAAVRGYRRDSR